MWALVVMMMVVIPINAIAGTATIEYIEPGKNHDGTPLTDLKEVILLWKQDAGAEQKITVPATSPAGGKAVSRTITFTDPPQCGKTTISVTAQAVDTSGNMSVKAGPATTTRDRTQEPICITPKEPTALKLTIQ